MERQGVAWEVQVGTVMGWKKYKRPKNQKKGQKEPERASATVLDHFSLFLTHSHTDDKLIQALAQEKLKTASLHDQMLQMQDSLNRNSLAARDETTEVDRQQDLIEKLELRLQREVQVHANMHS